MKTKTLTLSQKALYWRQWSAVLRADPSADRHALHIAALGHDCSVKTMTNQEFDQVLAQFASVTHPNSVDSQLRQLDQPRRRLLWKIQVEQRACLSLYVEDPDAYIDSIITDKFGTRRQIHHLSHHAPGPGRPSQLDQLLFTLAARLDIFRAQSGHTVAQMIELSKPLRPQSEPTPTAELVHASDDNCPF